MRQLIGWSLITAPLWALFVGHVIVHGLFAAAIIWGTALAALGLIALGAWLAFS